MTSIVRDDIIGLESFVDAEFKYKEYIEILAGCGGYCFLDQFERLIKDDINYETNEIIEKRNGKYIAKKMEDAGFIKSEYFSNYKYVVLTANALKYLYYRNVKRDFSDIPKNKIPIKNLSNKPSEKILFTSTMYFELAMREGAYIDTLFLKENHIESLNQSLKIDNEIEIKKLESYLIKHHERLQIIQPDLNNAIEASNFIAAARANNKKLEELLEEKKQDLNNAKFIKSEKNLDYIDKCISLIKDSHEKNNIAVKYLVNIQKARDTEKDEISKIENEVNQLKSQEFVNEKANAVIEKIIVMRDISKVICIYSPSEKKLFFRSVFVSNHKSNYDGIINDTIRMFKTELNIDILEVQLDMYSIEDNKKKVDSFIKKLWENVIKEASINYRTEKINYIFNYETLEKLQRYFDRASYSINYIKNSDIDMFKRLQEKLTPGKSII